MYIKLVFGAVHAAAAAEVTSRLTGQMRPSVDRDDRTQQPLAHRSPRLEKNMVFSPVILQLQPTGSTLHAFRIYSINFTMIALPHQLEE